MSTSGLGGGDGRGTASAAAGGASLAAGVCAAENAAAIASDATATRPTSQSHDGRWAHGRIATRRRIRNMGAGGVKVAGGEPGKAQMREHADHDVDAAFRAMPGSLYVVATPLGNLRDLTLRALDVLATADVIAAEDTRVTATLLRRYGIATQRIRCTRTTRRRASEPLIAMLAAGKSVALVSDAGTPAISDPGARSGARGARRGLPGRSVARPVGAGGGGLGGRSRRGVVRVPGFPAATGQGAARAARRVRGAAGRARHVRGAASRARDRGRPRRSARRERARWSSGAS